MLQRTLQDIEHKLIDDRDLCHLNVKELLGLLRFYTKGKWIYPRVIKSRLSIDIKTAYNILGFLEEIGIVERYYELYCYDCFHYSGLYFRTINEIPSEFECDHCQKRFLSLENTIVLFKVIKE